jgi:hypothetical protein
MMTTISSVTLPPGTKAGCIILSLKTSDSGILLHSLSGMKEVQDCTFCWQSHAVFWDISVVVHLEFMPTGTTINSVLQKLKTCIQRIFHNI